MKLKKSGKTTVETIERYELSTDDIERIIEEACGLSGEIKFNWQMGQWISLDIEVKNITEA